nr:uncharacterized mitochondrial protein AtMg00810-like [Tanacetum cinerariifolium]
NNNKDALVAGKEHDDDIQKSVSPDFHSSSCGDQTRKQGDKTKKKDKDLSQDTDDVGAEADINNMESIISISPILMTRIHKDHPTSQIIGDLSSTTQTRSMARVVRDQVYQMDVKSAFLYGTIEEEVYVCKPPGFKDPENPDKVYKVVKALYRLHQAPRAWSSGKSASNPIDVEKPLLKDSSGEDVDVHTYRSMIGSLMYLTSSRPDIMFAMCACVRFQVTPKVSHLNAVKRIFRYLKGKPYMGLWYPKDSPFDLVAYSDSDYAGASLDRKSTTGGCQFLGCRLISWQCKKQIVVATSSIEAEYVAAASGCAQVLLMQNQLLDYGHVRETITITSTQNTNGIVQVEETLVSIRNSHVSIVQVEEVEEKPFRIILGLAGIVQLPKIRKQLDIHEGRDDYVLSTQEYIKQVIKDAGEDKDFNSRSWVGATEYVKANGGIVSGCIRDINTFLKNVKLKQVVRIIKSYSLNSLGNLKVTVRHLSVFSPNLSMHYLNITKKNMVKVFHKDFVPGNGSGVGESEMLMEEEEIVKLVEEEEMADLELHVYGNVIDQEDLYKFDEEVLDLVLEEEASESRAHEEWLEKCMQQKEEDAKHERQLLGFHGTI